MRTIKFRGLAYSGGWVYGNYIHSKRFTGAGNEHRIVCQDTGLESDVIPETVGQFIGLTDKNGNEIYEGDIVRLDDTETQVIYSNGGFKFVTKNSHGDFISWRFFIEMAEIIGNIHEKTKP